MGTLREEEQVSIPIWSDYLSVAFCKALPLPCNAFLFQYGLIIYKYETHQGLPP